MIKSVCWVCCHTWDQTQTGSKSRQYIHRSSYNIVSQCVISFSVWFRYASRFSLFSFSLFENLCHYAAAGQLVIWSSKFFISFVSVRLLLVLLTTFTVSGSSQYLLDNFKTFRMQQKSLCVKWLHPSCSSNSVLATSTHSHSIQNFACCTVHLFCFQSIVICTKMYIYIWNKSYLNQYKMSATCCNPISGTSQYLSNLLQPYTPTRQLRSTSDTCTFEEVFSIIQDTCKTTLQIGNPVWKLNHLP